MSKIWLITGCSTGFGRELAKVLLEQGHKVGVASRKTDDIQDIVDSNPDSSCALKLDVTSHDEVAAAVKTLKEKFGKIDVLVNNAGIGYFAALEEGEDQEIHRLFDINFFGLADITREVLPLMREQHSGNIVNIASIGGFVGNPGVGYYNATKFAVVGYSEALQKEVSPLGIHVTVVAPSGFRTDWAGRSANETKHIIEDYKDTARKNIQTIRNLSGKQPGDPVKAAKAILKAVESGTPPLYLLLGEAALRGGQNKIAELQKTFDAWKETTVEADFPKEVAHQ